MLDRILLVDDEEGLRFTFEMLLKRAGYTEVKGVSSFEEARDVVSRQSCDLIISDIVLEGATGIDILRHVKETGQNCPVVMITGYPSIETASEAVRLGAFDYIPKPVKKQALLDVVGRALAFRKEQLAEERRQAALRQDRAMQETIWQSLPALVVTVSQEHQIVALNDAASRWSLEWLPELSVGASVDMLPEPFASEIRQTCSTVLKTGEPVRKWMVRWFRPDQTEGELQLAASAVEASDTEGALVVLTAQDVSHLAHSVERKNDRLHRLVGGSPVMHRLFETIRNVGGVDAAVLIGGESGSGKELVAEALHYESRRKKGPLVKVDCTAIPDNLLESELFGHRRGAFTGASKDRQGRLAQADGGTLFLDEIGDISSRMQLRLLHFLQERNFYPVGRDVPVSVDVRIIAATNADLRKRVEEGKFREDLYFRLRVIDIDVPSLRKRGEDILFLARHFLDEYEEQFEKQFSGFSEQAAEKLLQYDWPGNVRELRHVVERAAVLSSGGIIVAEFLQLDPKSEQGPACSPPLPRTNREMAAEGPDEEAASILLALRDAGGNKAKAARLLGIDRSTLYRKMAAGNLDGRSSTPPVPDNGLREG